MKRLMTVLFFAAMACCRGGGDHGCSMFEITDRELVLSILEGERLCVQVEHGPSRESGWIYPVGYPQFFLTNGDMRAEQYIREAQKRKCFCKGEWWLKTNGVALVAIEVVKETSKCNKGFVHEVFYTNHVAWGDLPYKRDLHGKRKDNTGAKREGEQ